MPNPNPSRRLTLLIDFDGTLHTYSGWTGKEALGQPITKSRASILLLSRTYRIVYFSTRPAEEVSRWLRRYGFPEHKITDKKEPAHLIIDDRALTFPGEWTDSFLAAIHSFHPHWQNPQTGVSPPAADVSVPEADSTNPIE